MTTTFFLRRDNGWCFNEMICFAFQTRSLGAFFVTTFWSMTETTTLTEFEENVSFDADDPDFAPSSPVMPSILRDSRYFVEKFDVKGRYILTFFFSSPAMLRFVYLKIFKFTRISRIWNGRIYENQTFWH